MKVKYFLRGLGMGIVFTALLLTIAGGGKKQTLTDEEIMMRASLLGMVRAEETPLFPPETPAVTESPEPSKTPETPAVTGTPEPSKTPETPAATESPKPSKNPETSVAEESPEPSKTPEKPAVKESPEPSKTPETPVAKESPEPSKISKEPEYVTVTIKGGMWSKEVAKAMEAVGLVSDAEKFDDYLCSNGYASSIRTGTYKIPADADYNEIAEKITK